MVRQLDMFEGLHMCVCVTGGGSLEVHARAD